MDLSRIQGREDREEDKAIQHNALLVYNVSDGAIWTDLHPVSATDTGESLKTRWSQYQICYRLSSEMLSTILQADRHLSLAQAPTLLYNGRQSKR